MPHHQYLVPKYILLSNKGTQYSNASTVIVVNSNNRTFRRHNAQLIEYTQRASHASSYGGRIAQRIYVYSTIRLPLASSVPAMFS